MCFMTTAITACLLNCNHFFAISPLFLNCEGKFNILGRVAALKGHFVDVSPDVLLKQILMMLLESPKARAFGFTKSTILVLQNKIL